jgi:hypothetical protein
MAVSRFFTAVSFALLSSMSALFFPMVDKFMETMVFLKKNFCTGLLFCRRTLREVYWFVNITTFYNANIIAGQLQ